MSDLQWQIGGPAPPAPDPAAALVDTMRARLLYSVRAGPNARAFVGIFAQRIADTVALCTDVQAITDLDTTTGVHLDVLGRLLGLPRFGTTDDRYRVLLKIQALLVLTSAATASTILRIVELFTGLPPIEVHEHYPLGFSVTAIVDPADAPLLASLIKKAKGVTYNADVVVAAEAAFLRGDTHDEDVDDPGHGDTDDEDVADAYPAVVIF